MEITLGQQYDVGKKPTAILYILFTLIAMQGHQKNIENKTETTCSTPSHMVVVIYYVYYVGYEYKSCMVRWYYYRHFVLSPQLCTTLITVSAGL